MIEKGNGFTEVDNFEEIGNLLFGNESSPLKEGEFYFLQILVRGKDGNKVSGNNKNRLVKYYRIHSLNQLFDLKNEIIGICKAVNGRAYVHPTRRDSKEVAKLVLDLTARTYVCENWIGLQSAYSTACGKSYVKGDKKFIVDLDHIEKGSEEYEKIKLKIESVRGSEGKRIAGEMQTIGGWHLITKPFDVGKFSNEYPKIDVHKNNPTLLYFYRKE